MLTFEVALDAVVQAIDLGLGTDTDAVVTVINNFARRAALTTHARGNRRYGGYVLRIEGPRVYAIEKFYSALPICPECYDTGVKHRRANGVSLERPCPQFKCAEVFDKRKMA